MANYEDVLNEIKNKEYTNLSNRNKPFTINKKTNNTKKNKVFKKSSYFNDGYDFGDVTKTILSTVGNAGINITKGFMNTVEGTVDAARTTFGDLTNKSANLQADVWEFLGNKSYANELRKSGKKVKDLTYKNAQMDVTGALLGETKDLFNNNWSEKLNKGSVSGDLIQSVEQGIGNIGAFVGMGFLTGGSNVSTFANSFASAYGNTLTNSLRNGESEKEAKGKAITSGMAEAISEQFFQGIPGLKSAGWADKYIGNAVGKYFSGQTGKVVLKTLDSVGEGVEEILSNALEATFEGIRNKKDIGTIFSDIKENTINSETGEAFISALISSALTNGGSTIISSKQKSNIINSYAKEHNMSVKETKNLFDSIIENKAKLENKTNYKDRIETEEGLNKQLQNEIKNNSKLDLNELFNATQNQNQIIDNSVNQQVQEIEQKENRTLNNKEIADIRENTINSKQSFQLNENESRKLTDNDIELANSLSNSGFNNTEKSHNLYNVAKSLQNSNKSAKIRFISNENLAEMGINIDTTQKTVNGFKKGDTIYININGRNAFETTIGHEIGEAIKSADNNSYTELKNLVKQVFGEQDLTSYQESYTAEDGTMLTDNVEDEWVNDKLGELFENENLRNRIADNRTLLQKVIDNIKSIVNKVTGKDQQKLKTLQQQLEDKFVELYKNTDFSNSKGDTAYGLLDKFKKKNKETINYNISKEFVNEIDYKTRQANKDNKDVKYLSTNTIYDLINNKGNRTIEEEKRLFESIKQNGIKNPIRIANNNGNFEIVDGNHRIEIAKNIGLEEIPVVYDEYFSDVELESDNWYNQLEEKYNAKRNVKVDEENQNESVNNNRGYEIGKYSRKNAKSNKLYQRISNNNDRSSTKTIYENNTDRRTREDVDNTSFSLQQQLENNLSKQIEQYNRDYDTLSNEFRDYAQYELNKSLNEVTDNDIRDFIEGAYNDMDAPDNNDGRFMNQTEINRAVKIIKDSLNQDIKYSLTDNQEDRIAKLQEEYNQWDKTREVTFDERDNLRKELNNLIRSEEYKNAESKFMDMVRSGMNPDEISRTNEYQLMVREEQIRKQLKEYDDDIKVMTDDMTRISEMIENEEKSHRNPEKAIKEAKTFFGTTKDFREAAYLLQDGTMLDFSGRTQGSNTYGRRTLDHREINEVGYDMGEFIELGNIRMKPEASGFELSKPLTDKQKSVLRDYLETLNDDIIIDITKNEQVLYDSAKYRNGTSPSKIFSDLDYYFENGKFPAKSELADFYYSLTKNEDIAPITNDNLTYSRDVELAPIRQDINNLTEQVKNLSNQLQTSQEMARINSNNDIAPVRNFKPINEQQANQYQSELQQDENYWKMLEEMTNTAPNLDEKTINKLTKNMATELGLKRKQITDLKPIIQNSFDRGLSLEEIKQELKNNFGYQSVVSKNDDIIDAQKEIRQYKIKVSPEIQKNIADYGYWKQKYFGKIKFSNEGDSVDSTYMQLNEYNPALFPNDIINETDQLLRIAEVSDMDKKYSIDYEMDENTINDVANYIKDTFDETLYANAIKSNNDLEESAMQYNDKIKEIPIKKRTRKEIKAFLQNGMGITQNDLALGNDISSVGYQLTTPERVNEKVFGREVGRKINEETVLFAKHQEAERTRFLNKERQEIKDLGIKARSKESALVQQYGEGILDDVQLAQQVSDKATQDKIKNAARVLRSKYDDYLDQINVELVDMGYDPIPKRKDYMRHFQELTDKFSQAGIPFNRQALNSENLPTDINGLTEFNVPGKNWFASAQKRTGDKTTYDAITGIDGYLEGASNLMYHTETIQRYRALEDLIRNTYGQKNGLNEFGDDLTSEAAMQRITDIQNGKLSNYTAWIHEQANSLAGKKGALDRGVERALGRKAYTVANQLKKQTGSNMTGFNVRSALTNFISTTIAASKTNKLAMVKGTVDTIKNMFHQDNFIDKSDFLTSRFGSDSLSKKTWDKISNAGQIFMSGSDWFTSNVIVRSKYYEGISKGMTETQAMNYANDFGARVMGDRSKGATAEAFNSKTLGILTQFQLETNNQWQYMIHDTKMDFKDNVTKNGGLKAGATVLFQMGQLAAYSYLFNEMFEKLTGSRAAFDITDIIKKLFGLGDDDKEKDFEERMKEAGSELVDALPFASLFGSGGRMPIGEMLEPLSTAYDYVTGGTDKYGNDIKIKDVGKSLKETIPYYVLPTGYGQIKKTAGGLEMYNENLPTPGSYTDSGNLRFTADTDTASIIKNGLFGKWADEKAQDYIDSGYKTIPSGKVQEMIDLGMDSTEYRDYRTGLSNAGTKNADKIDYIGNLNVPINEKNIMASNVLDRTVDMSNYDKFSSYEEFDYAYKNPDKYNMMSAVKSYNDFNTYKTKIDDIREKYSTAKGYSTDERKTKVISYVNSLNLNIPQKAMMIRQYYSSYDNYNNEIVNYIGNLDYTYDEKVGILEQLGMKVDTNGNVTW